MSTTEGLTPARRRVAERLKYAGEATAAELAPLLGLTRTAIRQHLQELEALGLVTSTLQPAAGRGRPSQQWSLTHEANTHFPDRHGELTVGLIDAIRASVGEAGLDRIVDARGAAQKKAYAALLPPPTKSLKARVQALAEQRTREGYMAEVREEKRGTYLLVENHCPICEAATACMGLCRVELEVFQHALGKSVQVERSAHLLGGDTRCVYRITKR